MLTYYLFIFAFRPARLSVSKDVFEISQNGFVIVDKGEEWGKKRTKYLAGPFFSTFKSCSKIDWALCYLLITT